MATCLLCEKKPKRAVRRVKLRGKFNPTKVYQQKPNLQWVTLSTDELIKRKLPATKKRIRACTKCIKRLYKT